MKKLLLIAATALLSFGSYAQQGMAEMMEYATPGDMHKLLGKYNGSWTANTKIWMDPTQPPMEATADVLTDMYYGDRYQKSMYNGNLGGMPYQGENVIAYDNSRKIFINTWVDNMGTGIMYSEGEWNAAKKTIEFKGKMTDPMSKEHVPFRQVLTLTSNESYKMEMYNTMHGQEFKSMEITFKRNG
jgi:hypothetical protein